MRKLKVGDIVRILEDEENYLTKGKLARVIRVLETDLLVKELQDPYEDGNWWTAKENVELIEENESEGNKMKKNIEIKNNVALIETPLLTEEERKFLSYWKINYLVKDYEGDITIYTKNDSFYLLTRDVNITFNSLEINKEYTPEELGL